MVPHVPDYRFPIFRNCGFTAQEYSFGYAQDFESLAILYIADLIFMWYRNHILFMAQPRRKHDLSGREEISYICWNVFVQY